MAILLLIAVTLHGCAGNDLEAQLSELASTSKEQAIPSSDLLTAIRAIRPHVLVRNDPTLDSMFNAVVVSILQRQADNAIDYYDRHFLLTLHGWADAPTSYTDRGSLMSVVMYHRFRGNHDAARSIGIQTNLMADPGDAGNPELLANVALEYSRIGLAEQVIAAAGRAAERYKATGHDRGALYAQRLLVSAYLSTGDVDQARFYLRKIRLACDTLDTMQAADDHTVTTLTLLHNLKQYPQYPDLPTIAFGVGLADLEQTYASYASIPRKPWLVGSIRPWHPSPGDLPLPIIRAFSSSDILPVWADDFRVSSDGMLTAVTPIGSYVHVGDRWLLHSDVRDSLGMSGRPTVWTSDTMVSVSQPIQFIVGVGTDSVLILTRDSLFLAGSRILKRSALPTQMRRLASKPNVRRAQPTVVTLVTKDATVDINLSTLRAQYAAATVTQTESTAFPDMSDDRHGSTKGLRDHLIPDSHPAKLRGLQRHSVDATAPYVAVRFLDRLDVIDTSRQVLYTAAYIPFPMVEPWGAHDSWTVIPSEDGHPRCVIPYGNAVRSIRLDNAVSLARVRPLVSNTTSTMIDVSAVDTTTRTIHLEDGYDYTVSIHQPFLASRMPVSIAGLYERSDRRIQSLNRGTAWRIHANNAVDGAVLTLPNNLGTWRIVVSRPLISEPVLQITAYTLSICSIVAFGIIAYRSRKRRLAALEESIRQEQLALLREDMHDMIGSRLVRIASLARQGGQQGGEEVLGRIHEMTTTTIRSLRNMLSLMSDEGLSDADFFGMMREYVTSACIDASIECTVVVDVSEESRLLSNLARHELLMIITEMVTNSMRHAQCTKTHLSVSINNRRLLLRWSDNGRGIDPNHTHGHGLNNIERRSSRMRATVTIEPVEPHGTCFVLELSL